MAQPSLLHPTWYTKLDFCVGRRLSTLKDKMPLGV